MAVAVDLVENLSGTALVHPLVKKYLDVKESLDVKDSLDVKKWRKEFDVRF